MEPRFIRQDVKRFNRTDFQNRNGEIYLQQCCVVEKLNQPSVMSSISQLLPSIPKLVLGCQLCLFSTKLVFVFPTPAPPHLDFSFHSPVLSQGPGRFLHRLLVSNRAQHALRLSGQDTNSGEAGFIFSQTTIWRMWAVHFQWFAEAKLKARVKYVALIKQIGWRFLPLISSMVKCSKHVVEGSMMSNSFRNYRLESQ